MTRLSSLLFIACVLLSSVPSISFAQLNQSISSNALLNNAPLQCSDYYLYGAMQAETTFLAETAVAGLPAEFETSLTNTFSAPLVDVSVLARIYTVDASGAIIATFGTVNIASDVTFAAGESKAWNFSWSVPEMAPSGEYMVSVYVLSNGQYNLIGAPFSDQLPGSTVTFTVVGESSSQPVILTAAMVTVNGESYPTDETPMAIPAGEPVKVSAVLKNASTASVIIPLEWRQFAWSEEMDDSLRNQTTELVTLAPQETKTVTYTTVPQADAVIYITATTPASVMPSMVDVRLIQEDVNQLRTGYLGLSAFPFVAGEVTTAVACAQNINRTIVDMAQVTLTLKDRNGDVIHTIDYFGPVVGALQGYGESFTPEKNYNFIKIESTLVRNGEIEEFTSVTYDCTTIDPDSCLEEMADAFNVPANQPTNLLLFVGGLMIALLLIVVVVYFFRRRGAPPSNTMPPPSNPSVTLSILFALMVVGAFPSFASAQSCAPLQFGYESAGSASDVTLYQGAVAPNCLSLCNAAMVSRTGTWYCNSSSQTVGMQWGFVVPDVSLSNGTLNYSCRLSQQPVAYVDPFSGLAMLTGRGWSGSACTPAAPTNNPPATPTISGPNTGQPNTSYSFNVSSTDPDGNTLRYGIDVNNDSLVDAWLPSSGYTNSGTQLPYSRSWSGAGTYTIRAIAEDNSGARSSWASHSITIATPAPTTCGPLGSQYRWNGSNWDDYSVSGPIGWSMTNIGMTASTPPGAYSGPQNMGFGVTRTMQGSTHVMSCGVVAPPPIMATSGVDLTINGSNGPLTVAPGTALNLVWTSSAVTFCGISGVGTSNPIPVSGSRTVSAVSSETYMIACNNGIDIVIDSVNVTVTAPPPPVGTCTLGPEIVGDSGPTNMFAGTPPCQSVDDLAPFSTPSCPGGATTGTVVNTSSIVNAGFCATRQTQSSQCFGTAYIRSCNGTPPPPVLNQPPAAPTIIGPDTGTPTNNYSFAISATDPNGDQVRYGVDWDSNGVVDIWLPSAGYVNSGTAQTATRSWPTDGPKSFRVLTQDAAGAVSGWATHFITISTVTNGCVWNFESSTDDFTAAPSNSNITCFPGAPRCSTLTPPVTAAMDGQSAANGSPATCILSCSVSGSYRNVDQMTTQGAGCTNQAATCSSGGIWYGAANQAEYTAAQQSCRNQGFTELLELGQEDAVPGFVSNPQAGTCGGSVQNSNGAVQYQYFIYGVPSCNVILPLTGSPTLSGTTCEIPAGASSCTGTASWDLPTALNPIIRNDTHNIIYGMGTNGSGNLINLRYDGNVITAYDDTTLIDRITLTTRCADGSFWNGSVCQATTGGGSSCFANQVVDITGTSCGPNGDPVTQGTVNMCTEGCGNNCGAIDILDTLVCFLPMVPVSLPNLTSVLNVTDITPSASGNNSVAGTYSTLTISSVIRNTGDGSTNIAVPYSLRLTNQTTNVQNNHAAQVGTIAGNSNTQAAHGFTNVPFGRYTIRIDADPQPDVIPESNELDNWAERADYILPPPDPNLRLGVSPGTVVRAGTVVTLDWTVNVSYDMTCTLIGPALASAVSFNPRTNGTTGTVTAGPITATSDYTLTCVEPITNTTFTDTTRVETVGTVEEI